MTRLFIALPLLVFISACAEPAPRGENVEIVEEARPALTAPPLSVSMTTPHGFPMAPAPVPLQPQPQSQTRAPNPIQLVGQ